MVISARRAKNQKYYQEHQGFRVLLTVLLLERNNSKKTNHDSPQVKRNIEIQHHEKRESFRRRKRACQAGARSAAERAGGRGQSSQRQSQASPPV